MNGPIVRHRQIIERAEHVLFADHRIMGAYLIGSYAAGTADHYSDIDLHCVVADDDLAACLADLDTILEAIGGRPVLVDAIPGVAGAVAFTADWQQIDLIMHAASEYDPHEYDAVKPIFDRTGSLLPPARVPDLTPGPAVFPHTAVVEFFFFLGKLPAFLGRNELVVAHTGITASRGRLIELMHAERGLRSEIGMKRLNATLSDEQRAVLEAMPAAGADRDQIIAANRYLTRHFIVRGKRLAERVGASWPQEFQDATIAHVRRCLGVDFAV